MAESGVGPGLRKSIIVIENMIKRSAYPRCILKVGMLCVVCTERLLVVIEIAGTTTITPPRPTITPHPHGLYSEQLRHPYNYIVGTLIHGGTSMKCQTSIKDGLQEK